MQVPLWVGTKLVSPEEGKFLRYPAEAACCVLSPANKSLTLQRDCWFPPKMYNQHSSSPV